MNDTAKTAGDTPVTAPSEADALASVRTTLETRIRALDPLVAEHRKLTRALAALDEEAPVRTRRRRKPAAAS